MGFGRRSKLMLTVKDLRKALLGLPGSTRVVVGSDSVRALRKDGDRYVPAGEFNAKDLPGAFIIESVEEDVDLKTEALRNDKLRRVVETAKSYCAGGSYQLKREAMMKALDELDRIS